MPAGGVVLVLPKESKHNSDKKAPVQDDLSQGSPALAQEAAQHGARQRPGPVATGIHRV